MMRTAYPYNLGMLFEMVAADCGHIPALLFPDAVYSFERLSALVERLGNLLLRKGCRQGDVIAIGHEKQPLSYAMMLAALRLGIPYVNIDIASPTERNSRILRTSQPRLLFYDLPENGRIIEQLAAQTGCETLLLTETELPLLTDLDRVEQEKRLRLVDGSCIAYIMFTSGSTGNPKGVAVTHQNVLHLIEWGRERFKVTTGDVFANLSPMYFDNSVFDFYVGLFSGAALAPVPRKLLSAPYELVEYISARGCTIWFSVPSLLIYLMTMKAIDKKILRSLRIVAFGGEGYPKNVLKKLYDLFASKADLVNVYGPTECTCICSAHTLSDEDFSELDGLPMLGRLNQNFDYMILDESGQEASSGELCLIGPNVSAGYFNDQERTAAAFSTLVDPKRFMKRMYRTGDLVRESHGNLYFIGRGDNQIKHMGYRIELEEIEHALMGLLYVRQAAVLYQRKSEIYGKIVAFVATDGHRDEKELLRTLAEFLPAYMIPGKITIMPELPKNPNGKVDRNALKESLHA